MSKTLIIAELGSSWRFGSDHLANAEKMIREAKACGADVAKFQWTSSASQMAKRRGLGLEAEKMYATYLKYPAEWLQTLKVLCDASGIEFMCTVYLPQDIPVIAPLVKRMKVSAYESGWPKFLQANVDTGKEVIFSIRDDQPVSWQPKPDSVVKSLICVSKYPTPLEDLHLASLRPRGVPYKHPTTGQLICLHSESFHAGLSDHTTSTLTGALAVAAGATILEKHVRLWDTPPDNPDYGHSLILDSDGEELSFAAYCRNVREAERCM